MNKRFNKLFFISVVLNLLLVFFTAITLFKMDEINNAKAEFKKWNAANNRLSFHYYERTTLFNELPVPEDSIVFLGDSLTFRTEWSELFPGKKVINRGIGNDTTAGVLKRLDNVIEGEPKKIFILIGVNDLKSRSVADAMQNYRKIIKRIQSGTPNTDIYIQSLLPVNNNKYGSILSNDKIIKMNKELRALAKNAGVTYIDLHSRFAKNGQLPDEFTADGIHLTGKGYVLWRDTIQEYVE
jgi:lysophospholipase L1-like esterase